MHVCGHGLFKDACPLFFSQMKVYKASEEGIDDRLELDKRKDSRAFCCYFESEEVLPLGFYDLQNKIRDGLQEAFCEKYDNGENRNSWDRFYFSAELLISERIIIEMTNEILDDKLVGLILEYLKTIPSPYCVIVAVYKGMQRGSEYLGRFIINLDEIVVEASLWKTWSSQITVFKETSIPHSH